LKTFLTLTASLREHGRKGRMERQSDSLHFGDFELDLADLLSSLKSLLWYKVGVERNGQDLSSALEQLSTWTAYPLAADFRDVESWTLQNMLQTSWLVTYSALRRAESRGVHYRADHPDRDDLNFSRHLAISRADF
jgi:L-aspartate oxidase